MSRDYSRLMGDLDVKIVDLKASYERQTLGELQDASQRLREIEATMGTARRLLAIKAEGANSVSGEPDYAIRINRTSGSGTSTFDATNETILEPGDVIEVTLKRRGARQLVRPDRSCANFERRQVRFVLSRRFHAKYQVIASCP